MAKREASTAAIFWRRGEPKVWMASAALAGMLSLVFVLLAVVMVNGLGVFWPGQVAEITLTDGNKFLGRQIRIAVNPDNGESSIQFKTGNREQDPQRQDFRWVKSDAIREIAHPGGVCVLERIENGDFFGYVKGVAGPDLASSSDAAVTVGPEVALPNLEQAGRATAAPTGNVAESLSNALQRIREKSAKELAPIAAELFALSNELQETNGNLLQLKFRRLAVTGTTAVELDNAKTGPRTNPLPEGKGTEAMDRRIAKLQADNQRIKEQSDRLVSRQQQQIAELRRNVVVMADPEGKETSVALVDIVRSFRPNEMGFAAKCGHYMSKIGELLWENPRESNTEGGLFPAIFGTVMLIFLMAVLCFPLGVLAGIYLGEYAKDGFLVRVVRIAVNNLAGIPSIVYGIFGLGFFIYGIGGLLDQWFFPEQVAAGTPTFGTGGILWASLTLGLLTVPVVIVSTEEALRAIPRATREGSYALGATKLQTLVRVLVPMASPGMMTGFILAMARAAGEVAPLMITGVVKLAPQMPLDGVFPFFHPDRKFMHLGFHIYDVGFQSPNVEASKPMVYVTTLLLLLIVLAMSSVAIYLRNRMRKRYQVRSI
jgi:phosphate transport system permease protein